MALANATAASPDVNAIAGVIKRISFLGTHLQYVVGTAQGAQIIVEDRISSTHTLAIKTSLDSEVHVTWPASASLCFKEEES